MPSVREILGVILGGGVGTRLYPLTKERAKPAVPIAGKYRLIDVPISNCINSGIHRIAVLTQFNSVSLHRHISRTYIFDAFHRGWVQILAAEQTPRSTAWYEGTADAVRKQMLEIKVTEAKFVIILAGDHLYRMDYRELAEYHWQQGADITVAVQPVQRDEATRFGLLKRSSSGLITSFAEKPKDPKILADFVSRNDPEHPYLGSMGIYMFNMDVLVDIMENTTDDDFGGEVIPNAIHSHNVFGFDFEDYWEDIGTIRSFYETNLALCRPDAPFKFHDPQKPIYTRQRYLPPSSIGGATLHNAFVADGCYIEEVEIHNSVIGLRSQIHKGSLIKNVVMMGADYYDPPGGSPSLGVPLGIGPDCHLEGAIIDKNVRVGEGTVIKPFPPGTDVDNQNWIVRDGVIVILKNMILPPNTYITPNEV